jgi:hypothetical protein
LNNLLQQAVELGVSAELCARLIWC